MNFIDDLRKRTSDARKPLTVSGQTKRVLTRAANDGAYFCVLHKHNYLEKQLLDDTHALEEEGFTINWSDQNTVIIGWKKDKD